MRAVPADDSHGVRLYSLLPCAARYRYCDK